MTKLKYDTWKRMKNVRRRHGWISNAVEGESNPGVLGGIAARRNGGVGESYFGGVRGALRYLRGNNPSQRCPTMRNPEIELGSLKWLAKLLKVWTDAEKQS